MIINPFNLHKTASGWHFETEEVLEDFMFLHLEQVLGLTGLARQYIVQGQRCDILAVDSTKRLVVLELKNSEDRGIVQQLTRYYHVLLEEKPFQEQINYDLPVHLVAIAPSFHRDNLIDLQYHRLYFQFLEFFVSQTDSLFYLNLKDVDDEKILSVEIPYQEQQQSNLPPPPSALLKLLKNCDDQQKDKILQLRKKILIFDKRMQEFSNAGSILYGNGNGKTSKYCAELCLDKQRNILLFLWIPLKCGHSSRIGRAIIWTDWDDKALIEGYVSSGIGTELNLRRRSLNNIIKTIQNGHSGHSLPYTSYLHYEHKTGRKYHYSLPIHPLRGKKYIKELNQTIQNIWNDEKPILYDEIEFYEFYIELIKNQTGLEHSFDCNPYKSLENLIDLALEKWLARL